MPVILIVDDTPENLAMFSEIFMPFYTVKTVTSGFRALKSISNHKPDLILLDILMPGMDGYQVIQRLKVDPNTADIPVIFLTSLSDASDEARGLSLGALDYITKPINPALALARVKNHIDLKSTRENLHAQRAALDLEITRRADDAHVLQEVSIRTLSCIAEFRNTGVGNHMERTYNYMRVLCSALSGHPQWRERLPEDVMRGLIYAAPLHDIGKLAIPEALLKNEHALTGEEAEMLRAHTWLGSSALAKIGTGVTAPLLDIGRMIAVGHHERWDGTGYPQGLAEEEIPLPARIMALVDRFDTLLVEERPGLDPAVPAKVSDARHIERVVEKIFSEQGTFFDPSLVSVFRGCVPAFSALAMIHLEQLRQQAPVDLFGVCPPNIDAHHDCNNI
jgi:putative two-component system response regulator